MWTRLQALPPYPGGKRKLLGRIFKRLTPPTEAPDVREHLPGWWLPLTPCRGEGRKGVRSDLAHEGVNEVNETSRQVT